MKSSELADLTDRLVVWYLSALDVSTRGAAVRLVPYSKGPVGRHVKVPRLRVLVPYFAAFHVSRSIRALRPRLLAAALASPESGLRERLQLLDELEKGLPRRPRGAVQFLLAPAVLGIAYVAALSFGGSAHDLQPLRDLISAVFRLDWKDMGVAFGEYSWGAVFFTTLGLTVSVWLLLLVPMTSFHLKRLIFNLCPDAGPKLSEAAISEHRAARGGIYALEDELFAKLQRRRPRELRLDLVLEAILLFLALALAVDMAISTLQSAASVLPHRHHPLRSAQLRSVLIVALVAASLVRLAWIVRGERIVTRAAARDASSLPLPGWGRRLAAWLVDVVVGLLVWVGLAYALVAAYPALQSYENFTLELVLVYGVLFPLAPVPHVLVGYVLGGRRGGSPTLGKRLLGLRVVDRAGRPAGLRRLLVREVLLKWNLFGLFTSWLVLPQLVNYLRPLWQRQRRALHDSIARTGIARRQARRAEDEAPALAPIAAGV